MLLSSLESLQTCGFHVWCWALKLSCIWFMYVLIVPSPNAPHVLVDFVVFLPGHGRSVTDFWGWDAREVRLRCPDDVSGDIGGCSARRALKPLNAAFLASDIPSTMTSLRSPSSRLDFGSVFCSYGMSLDLYLLYYCNYIRAKYVTCAISLGHCLLIGLLVVMSIVVVLVLLFISFLVDGIRVGRCSSPLVLCSLLLLSVLDRLHLI